jgi:hypothetical protein
MEGGERIVGEVKTAFSPDDSIRELAIQYLL